MSDEFEMFDQPDDFLPGSVGEPGNRVFYMQARDGHRVTSLLSLIHISEPTRLLSISYAVFCLTKNNFNLYP